MTITTENLTPAADSGLGIAHAEEIIRRHGSDWLLITEQGTITRLLTLAELERCAADASTPIARAVQRSADDAQARLVWLDQ